VIIQSAFATMLDSGDLDRHLRKARSTYRARRAALLSAVASALPYLRTSGGAAGLHLMLWLPPHVSEDGVVAAAARSEVAVNALHRECVVSTQLGPALVLGYGGISEQAIPEAISRLAYCLGAQGIKQPA
jgi:GntR family transcriptional regulator/MocR family aminotransferase